MTVVDEIEELFKPGQRDSRETGNVHKTMQYSLICKQFQSRNRKIVNLPPLFINDHKQYRKYFEQQGRGSSFKRTGENAGQKTRIACILQEKATVVTITSLFCLRKKFICLTGYSLGTLHCFTSKWDPSSPPSPHSQFISTLFWANTQ